MIIIENPLKIKYKYLVFEVNNKTIEEFQSMEKARFLRISKTLELKGMIVNGKHFDSPIIINNIKTKKRIIDGQHRIHAIRQIIKENPEFVIQLLLVVYQDLDKDEEKEIFTRWNSGTKQTSEDIIQIYIDEIRIYEMLNETGNICIYYEPGKLKFRNIVQPYIMAKEENQMMYLNPRNFIEKAKHLGTGDAEKIKEFITKFLKHTKGNSIFHKSTGQYALVYTYFTNDKKDFWEKFDKIKKYKIINDAGEQQGRVAVNVMINLLKNKMFGISIPTSFRTADIFTEEKISWLRKNWPKSTWDSEDITQEFNEEFGTKVVSGTIRYYLTKNNIKKDEKFKSRKGRVFTREVIDYMKECSKKMTITEARKACELKFEHEFSVGFGQRAKKEGIDFCHTKEEVNFMVNPKQEKIVRKYKNKTAYEIKDKIIEELGEDVSIKYIKSMLKRINNPKEGMSNKEINKSLKDMNADDPDDDDSTDLFSDDEGEE